MTTVAADALDASRGRTLTIAPALAVAAMASIGAGAIHAAAIGVHSEHRQAVLAFTVVAAVQIGFGVLALSFANRVVASIGMFANTVFIGGWVLAKTSGIAFIEGLDVAEDIQTADAIAAGLAVIAVLGVLFAFRSDMRPSALGGTTLAITALVVALVATPAMVSAGSHSHAAGHADDGAGAAVAGHDHGAAAPGGGEEPGGTEVVVPPKPYDPEMPIDLSGVDGVTPQQQAQAENLIAITLLRLPQFADPATAEAAGYRSIGDGFLGYEHYINADLFDDGRILDPDYPESLVYQTDGPEKQLVAAMYMLESDATLDDVPDYGGKLMQWHIHNNLCFTTEGRVAGLTNADGTCNAPLVTGVQSPMVHVWIVPHECGPFAALEGVAGGQIKEGEERWCDHAHGSH